MSTISGTVGVLGTGYIGTNLITKLECIPNLDIEIFTRDNLKTLSNYTFDYFFNCAGNTGDFRANLIDTVKDNVNLSTFVLENLKIKKSYIYLSSTRVYGFENNQNIKFNESYIYPNSNLDINYIYDGCKMLCEALSLEYAKRNDFNAVILRLSNVYGNFEDSDLDNKTLLKQIILSGKNQDKITINDNSQSSKDYIHIHDALDFILKAAAANKTEVYNIAYGKSYSLEDICQKFNCEAVFDNTMIARHANIDISKAKYSLNYDPEFDIINLSMNGVMQNG